MARPIARGVLSFGLVAIPVEIHTATKSQNVSFNLLHAKCGSRIRNQIFCPACKIVVERADLVRGYEVAKGEYVRLTDAELESLEAEANRNIELKEFIPIQKIDPFYFERSYYLAPDEGGEKAYRLLAETMEKVGRTALAEMVSHDKEKLVLIRAAQGGLIMQVMHYANEVRDFGAIPKAEQERLTPTETDLAKGLVEKLSSEDFEPEAYADEYRKRVLAMLDVKQKGREVRIARPAPPARHVVDLMEALKRSMRETQVGRAKETAKGRKKA